jgi:hypothetical protein
MRFYVCFEIKRREFVETKAGQTDPPFKKSHIYATAQVPNVDDFGEEFG